MAEELAAVRGELARADEKASMLLALAVGSLVVVAAAGRHGLLSALLISAGVLSVCMALLVLLSVVRPRFGTTGFPCHARRTADHVRAELMSLDACDWRSRELTCLSRIALRKNERLRTAVDLLSLALVLMLAGNLLSL